MPHIQDGDSEPLTKEDAHPPVLASVILQPLPTIPSDEDAAIAEALRRDAELDLDPASGIEWQALKKKLGR